MQARQKAEAQPSLRIKMPAKLIPANVPAKGERILVLQPPWMELILGGTKTLEIRHQPLRSGHSLIGTGQRIWGTVELGEPIRITDMTQWKNLESQHRWEHQDKLPYKKTWALPILGSARWQKQVPYKHKQGTVGTARFEAVDADARSAHDAQASQQRLAHTRESRRKEASTKSNPGQMSCARRYQIGVISIT